ncbi:unnamed protein product [Chondrus crispus]|uniref:BZIP domain-containing protein n=1 Tax=Chondrus crispus TaxID=2769 RepID=R7QC15_CHOCR|nr:unnamed protein product [Chondrus crispus]CDF34985.1 unnamed protein product [Chondrus crispus]|eukprot:XP_005714804.1 unnamed protein product [Chondrus crispus]
MTFIASTPSEHEHAYLASLSAPAPASSALTPAVHLGSELHEFFRLCALPWVSDFLFNEEMDSLPVLTAPANMRSAISCTIQMTNVEAPSPGDNLFDTHLSGVALFVPAFSIASISVGFGVQECHLQSFSDWGTRSGLFDEPDLMHLRYVRDDATGALIIAYKDPHTNLFKVESMVQASTTTRRRVYAIFDLDHFRAAVNAEYCSFRPSLVANALKFLCSSVETRHCPKCAAPPSAACHCPLGLKLPSHSLDFSTVANNMVSFTGAFEGVTRSAVFNDGIELQAANLGCVINIDGCIGNDLIDRLSRWAISDQLTDKKGCPTALIMPPSGTDDAETTADMVIDTDNLAQVSAALSYVAPPPPPPAVDLFAKGTSSCSSGSGMLITESLDDPPPLLVPERAPPTASQIFETAAQAPPPTAHGTLDFVDEITGQAQVSDSFFNPSEPSTPAEESMSSGSAGMSVIAPSAAIFDTQPVVIGATLRNKAIAPSAPVQVSKETMQSEKELRAQLRKQRNREAAQRSNMKRKFKNDTLKQALRDVHSRAAQLRARELQLREENLELRKLMSP